MSTDEFTPDVLVRIIIAALEQRDTKGVDLALRMLASRDPDRAARVMETMKTGLALAGDK